MKRIISVMMFSAFLNMATAANASFCCGITNTANPDSGQICLQGEQNIPECLRAHNQLEYFCYALPTNLIRDAIDKIAREDPALAC